MSTSQPVAPRLTPWREFKAATANQRAGVLAIALIGAALLSADLFGATRAFEAQQVEHGAQTCFTVAHRSVCK